MLRYLLGLLKDALTDSDSLFQRKTLVVQARLLVLLRPELVGKHTAQRNLRLLQHHSAF